MEAIVSICVTRKRGRGHSPGNLADDIANSPGSMHVVQLIPPHVHVLFHPGDEGIIDVDLHGR